MNCLMEQSVGYDTLLMLTFYIMKIRLLPWPAWHDSGPTEHITQLKWKIGGR